MSAKKLFDPRFLVVSIGNPLPEYPSLHSAGHFALRGLQTTLQGTGFHPAKGKHGETQFLPGGKYTVARSPTLMNVSGLWVKELWKKRFLQDHEPESSCLVVVHDELEMDLGKVKLVSWDRSPRGHNGIKSVKKHIQERSFPMSPLVRIAVGIGRPAERDAKTVSDYVLKPCSQEQIDVFEHGEVPERVLARLEEVEREWKTEWEKAQTA